MPCSSRGTGGNLKYPRASWLAPEDHERVLRDVIWAGWPNRGPEWPAILEGGAVLPVTDAEANAVYPGICAPPSATGATAPAPTRAEAQVTAKPGRNGPTPGRPDLGPGNREQGGGESGPTARGIPPGRPRPPNPERPPPPAVRAAEHKEDKHNLRSWRPRRPRARRRGRSPVGVRRRRGARGCARQRSPSDPLTADPLIADPRRRPERPRTLPLTAPHDAAAALRAAGGPRVRANTTALRPVGRAPEGGREGGTDQRPGVLPRWAPTPRARARPPACQGARRGGP